MRKTLLLVAILSAMAVAMIPAFAFAEGGNTGLNNVTEVSSISELRTALAAGGDVRLAADIQDVDTAIIVENHATLDLNGHDISTDQCVRGLLTVNEGVDFTLSGGEGETKGSIIDKVDNAGVCVCVENSGNLRVENGAVINSSVTDDNTNSSGSLIGIEVCTSNASVVVNDSIVYSYANGLGQSQSGISIAYKVADATIEMNNSKIELNGSAGNLIGINAYAAKSITLNQCSVNITTDAENSILPYFASEAQCFRLMDAELDIDGGSYAVNQPAGMGKSRFLYMGFAISSEDKPVTANITGEPKITMTGSYGGTYSALFYDNHTGDGYEDIINITGNADVDISELSGTTKYYGYNNSCATEIINVSNGTFKGGTEFNNFYISGGKFDADPKENILSGYQAAKGDDGLYEVVPSNNKIIQNVTTGEKFGTIAAAVLAAKDGESLQMIGSEISSNEALTIGKSITLDLNGYKIKKTKITITGDVDLTDNQATSYGNAGTVDGLMEIDGAKVDMKKINLTFTAPSNASGSYILIKTTGTLADPTTLHLAGVNASITSGTTYGTYLVLREGEYSKAVVDGAIDDFETTITGSASGGTTAVALFDGAGETSSLEINGGTYYAYSGSKAAILYSRKGYKPVINDGNYKAVGVGVEGAGYYPEQARGRLALAVGMTYSPLSEALVNGGNFVGMERGSIIGPDKFITSEGYWNNKGTVTANDYPIAYLEENSDAYQEGYRYTIDAAKTKITADMISGLDESYDYTGSAITPDITVTCDGKALTEGTDYSLTIKDNTAVGTASVSIIGLGDYAGVVLKNFEIKTIDISEAEVTGIEDSYEYTTKGITPAVTVTIDGKELTAAQYSGGTGDYLVTYSDNQDVTTDETKATVTITGQNNYSGTITKKFEITPHDIGEGMSGGTGKNYFYTGSAIEPGTAYLQYNSHVLSVGTECTVEYKDNTEVGTATIDVKGIGNYTGSCQLTFNIVKITIDPIEEQVYTGTNIKPEVNVYANGELLTLTKDYRVSYTKNKAVGTATIRVTGANSYSGAYEDTFRIIYNIANATVTGPQDVYYNGEEQTFDLTVVAGSTILTEGTDYTVEYKNNKEPGTATIGITGIGNYGGSVKVTFEIKLYDITGAQVTGYQDVYYDGSEKTFDITVTLDGQQLVKDQDYTLRFENNEEPGEASVVITGMGMYTGTIYKTFHILQNDFTAAEVSGIEDVYYDGMPKTQSLMVTYNGEALAEGKDYQVEYKNNTEVGTATIRIAGIVAYDGTIEKTFQIKRHEASELLVSGIEDVTYNGKAQTQNLVITCEGKVLTEGEDYEVSYANNVNVGTAIVTITGKGAYEGTIQKLFAITPMDISEFKMNIDQGSYRYDGSQKTPSVTVEGLPADAYDLDLQEGRINAGTYRITATAKGNYMGSLTGEFTIDPVDISEWIPTLSKTTFVYTGKAQMPTVTADGLLADDYIVNAPAGRTTVGTYNVTVTGQGNYTGTSQPAAYRIIPARAVISKLTGASKSIKVTVRSQKASKVTKYQISYKKTSAKSWTTKTTTSTSYTIKSLKKKAWYYVKVRAYGNGTYGSWSLTKKIKTK